MKKLLYLLSLVCAFSLVDANYNITTQNTDELKFDPSIKFIQEGQDKYALNSGVTSDNIKDGIYDIEVSNLNSDLISKIYLTDVNIKNNENKSILIDCCLPGGYKQAFSFDFSEFTYKAITVSLNNVKGNRLYKCEGWNFTNNSWCGDWYFSQELTKGENYEFELNPTDDKGFGIIEAVDAWHLDQNRKLVENIYDYIKERDLNFTKPISANHYVRVLFEQNLTSENDITIYAKSKSSKATIEVYEKDGTTKIAQFPNIQAYQKYKIYLTGLVGTQDTFDLKIIGDPIEFDFIIDPIYIARPTDFDDISGKWDNEANAYDGNNATSATETQQKIDNDIYWNTWTTDIDPIYRVDLHIRIDLTGLVDDYLTIEWYVGATQGTGTYEINNTNQGTDLSITLSNLTEPNDGSWSWADVGNIEMQQVSTKVGAGDTVTYATDEVWGSIYTDPDAPYFEDATLNLTSPVVLNEYVNVSSNVIDALDNLDDVWAQIGKPDNTYENVTMNQIGATDGYYVEYQLLLDGIYNFTVYANDTLGNVNYTQTDPFTLTVFNELFITDYNTTLNYGDLFYVYVEDLNGDPVNDATIHYYMRDGVYRTNSTGDNGYYTILVENIGTWYINATKASYFNNSTSINVTMGHNYVYDNVYDFNGDVEGTFQEFGSPNQNYPINWSAYFPDGTLMFQQTGRRTFNSTDSLFGMYSLNYSGLDNASCWSGGAGFYVEAGRTYLLSGWYIQDNPYNEYYYGGGGHGLGSRYSLYNSSVNSIIGGITIGNLHPNQNVSGQGWLYYEEVVTVPETIGERGFLWYRTYWILTKGETRIDGLWITDITDYLNGTHYIDAGLGNDLTTRWHGDNENGTYFCCPQGTHINVSRVSGTVYNAKQIDYRPNPSINDSYVADGNWSFNVTSQMGLWIFYTNGSYENIPLLPGLTYVARNGNVTGFLFNETTPEIGLRNSTHFVDDANEGIHINFGDVRVDENINISTFQIVAVRHCAVLNISVINFDSDIVSVESPINYTVTDINFTIVIRPTQYYDDYVTRWINFTSNDEDESNFYVYVRFKSSSPEYTIGTLSNFMLEASNGSYAWTGVIGWSNPENFFDDNWTTYASVYQGAGEYFYVNHTKPEGAIRDNTYWTIKWNGLVTNISNLSIPQNVWDYSDTLMFRIYVITSFIPVPLGIIEFRAFNGASWDLLYSTSYQDETTLLYEESMIWNVSQFLPSDEYYFGNLQVDVRYNITYRVTHTGSSPNVLQLFSVYDNEYTYDHFDTFLAEGNSTILQPGNSTYFSASYLLPYYHDYNYSTNVYFTVNETYGDIDNSTTTSFKIMSSRPSLTYSKQTIFFGDLPVDIESSIEFLNLTNFGSPNNISINYLQSLDSNFKHYNTSFPYTILPNSYLEMYFTTIPHRYDLYNSSIWWNLNTDYGFISQSSAYLAYNSPTPNYSIEFINDTYLGDLQAGVSHIGYFNVFKTDLGPNQIDFWKHLNPYDPLGYVYDSFDVSVIDPSLVGAFDTYNAQGVFVKDDLCFVAEGGTGMSIYNISDLRNIRFVSNIDIYDGWFRGAKDIRVIGNIAYVSGLGQGISTIDVSNPYNPIELDSYSDIGLSTNFEVHNGLLYSGGIGYALRIFNVTDPTNITLLSVYNYSNVTGESWGHYDAFYDNGLCYITVDNLTEELEFGLTGRLIALNVTNPYNISYVGEYEENIGLAEVIVHDGIAYLSGSDLDTLYILNVSDPSNMSLIIAFNEGFNYTNFDLDTDDLILYVLDEGENALEKDLYENIAVINVSDPYNPSNMKILRLEGEGQRVHVNSDYIYVTDDTFGIKIFQKYGVVSANATVNATIPFSVHLEQYFDFGYNFSIAMFPVNAHRGIINESSYLNFSIMSTTPQYILEYIEYNSTNGYFGNLLIDGVYHARFKAKMIVDSPNNLSFVSTIDNESIFNYFTSINTYSNVVYLNYNITPVVLSEFDTVGFSYGVDIVGDIAYVADGGSGFRIINISDRESPTLLGYWDSSDTTYDIKVVGDIAYISDRSNLRTFNISDPTNPIFLDRYPTTPGLTFALEVIGNYAYVCTGVTGLTRYDISDPTNIVYAGNIDVTGVSQDVFIKDGYAYVPDAYELVIMNITEGMGGIVGSVVLRNVFGENPEGVYVEGNYAYVASGDRGLDIVDVSDVTNPINVSNYDTSGYAHKVYVYENMCFIADDTSGIHIINISDPLNPTLILTYDTDGSAMNIHVEDTLMYISDGSNGIPIISLGTEMFYDIWFEPQSYFDDNYTVSIWLNPDERFGNIDNSSRLDYSIMSSTPSVSNLDYDYNGSYIDVIPQEILSFNFSLMNFNLNTIQAKTYIWILEDCTLTQNFSTIVSSQYEFNSTYSIIQVLRDVSEFSQRIQSVEILFYGIGSQSENNLFNITIYPNFTMVYLEYIFPLLTEFTDKDLDVLYSVSDSGDPWRVFNTGSIDFNIVTRIDDYSSSEFSFIEWNYMNGEDTYHEINAYSLHKLTFDNPTGSHQAEFYLNVSASEVCTLRLDINSVIHTQTIYSTNWHVIKFYTDDLVDGENEIIFRLSGSSGAKIYLKNASANDNTTFYEFDPFSGYIEQTSSSIGIDFIFCDFILHRRVPKYDMDGLQIDFGDYETWDMSYYPSTYTSFSRVRITFVLYDNNSNYLDNFTAFFEFECPRRVFITSNIDDLDIYVYVGETNAINVLFENIGTTNCTITNMSVSIPWFIPTGYENRELNINDPINITFITNNLLTSYFADQTYFGTLTLHTTNEGFYSESMYIYVRLRPIFILVQPIDATRYIEREQDEIVTTSFTIRNDGLGEGFYSIYIIDPNISEDYNILTYLGTSFYLEPGEEKTIEFQVSGDIISDNETFFIQIEQDGVVVSTFTIIVKTTELTKPKSWTWGILLWIVALVTLIGALIVRRRFSKKNERDQVEIDKRDEYNFEKERKGYGERKPTSKLQMKQMGRKLLVGIIFGAVLALVLIPIYLWYQGSYKAPWEIGSAIKDQM